MKKILFFQVRNVIIHSLEIQLGGFIWVQIHYKSVGLFYLM